MTGIKVLLQVPSWSGTVLSAPRKLPVSALIAVGFVAQLRNSHTSQYNGGAAFGGEVVQVAEF